MFFDEGEITRGIGICLDNARDLTSEAEIIFAHRGYARALALGILALEEVGKLVYINCLAFSLTQNTHQASFDAIHKQHHAKLAALHAYPLLLTQFAGLDERMVTDGEWQTELHGIVQEFNKHLFDLEPWIGSPEHIVDLHRWKQKAFYVDFDRDKGFLPPSEIDRAFAERILKLAQHVIRGLDFVLTDNLVRYQEVVSAIRRSVKPEQFEQIRQYISATIAETRES